MKSFKTKIIYVFAVMALTAVFAVPVFSSTTDGTIDTTYKYAWGENIGWVNFGTANGDVHITDSGMSGYALSETIGWVNLDNVVNDGAGNLFGYAWSENTGHINFNPTNGGVIINSSGEFTGSALSETVGWIIFDGDYKVKTDWRSQVSRSQCNNSLDDDGDGKTDYPDDPGCDSLDDDDETDPGGGGLPPAAHNPPSRPEPTPENPKGKFGVLINNGDEYANNSTVTLKLNAGSDTVRMAISNTPDFANASQIPFQEIINWDLSKNIPNTQHEIYNSKYAVYAKFYTQYGKTSPVVSDKIILDTVAPEIKITEIKDYYSSAENVILIAKTEANAEVILRWDKKYGLIYADKQGRLTINLGKMSAGNYQLELTPTDLAGNEGEVLTIDLVIKLSEEISEPSSEIIPKVKKEKLPLIERIPEILEPFAPEILEPLIPEFLKPKKKEEEKLEEMIVIPEETPSAMRGQWKLLSEESIKTFVLTPLPKEIRKLAEKFPELRETLKKVGITKITDLEKLKTVKLTLPGLTERMGLPTAKVEPGKFALPAGVPVAELSPEAKQQIPTEIVFAKTGGELIDLNIALTVNEKGEPQQKITAVSGKPLQLVVRPDKPVKNIKGYVVFKSKIKKQESRIRNPESFAIRDSKFVIQDIAASLVFANPVFAQEHNPIEIEERLVLLEFEYTDRKGDGIYTTEIQTPLVEGEYEIITVMDFEDLELGKKEIRLIAVVDPEGYIYTVLPAGKLRIAGAIVSIYWLNPEIKQYELWPAKECQQENPQITDDTGKYSFLTPPGTYYLRIEHPNYPVYQSETFIVKESSGIHMNIELKTNYQWLKVVDWKTILLILVIILLAYNFYRDRKRNK